jgi:hypothetical protein
MEAWRIGDLAAPDQYALDPALPVDEQAMAAAAAEAAAARTRANYQQAIARDPESNRLKDVAEVLAPQTPLDYALMLSGPLKAASIPARAAIYGGAAAMQPEEAQAGPAGAAAKFVAKAPAIVSRALPSMDDITSIFRAAKEFGRKGWPEAEKPIFKTTPEAYAETEKLVPQRSVKAHLPGAETPADLPNKGRAAIIMENTPAIAENIATRLRPMVESDSPLLKFYHTGPVIRGLERDAGMEVPGAVQFLREWAGQGAATSPRTQTPPNLRNSSYLMYERARGDPLTPERYLAEGNRPGFPMMGMHVNLAEDFATRGERPWANPKPYTFRENWSGNLRDVTGDTHNIRSTLYEMDQLQPGSLPRGWFTNDKAFAKYRKEGFGALDAGDIVDTLGSKAERLISRQTEYLPMVEPWYQAAEKLGIAPASAQSGGWFSYGPITGLQSPPKTITNLLNDQLEATAKAINVPTKKALEWWSQGKIPLAGIGGGGVLSKAAMGELARQDEYD